MAFFFFVFYFDTLILYIHPGLSRCHQVAQPCVQILHRRCRASSYPNEDHRARRLTVHPCYEWTHFLSGGETIIALWIHCFHSFSTKPWFPVLRLLFLLLYLQVNILFSQLCSLGSGWCPLTHCCCSTFKGQKIQCVWVHTRFHISIFVWVLWKVMFLITKNVKIE